MNSIIARESLNTPHASRECWSESAKRSRIEKDKYLIWIRRAPHFTLSSQIIARDNRELRAATVSAAIRRCRLRWKATQSHALCSLRRRRRQVRAKWKWINAIATYSPMKSIFVAAAADRQHGRNETQKCFLLESKFTWAMATELVRPFSCSISYRIDFHLLFASWKSVQMKMDSVKCVARMWHVNSSMCVWIFETIFDFGQAEQTVRVHVIRVQCLRERGEREPMRTTKNCIFSIYRSDVRANNIP